MHNPNMLKYQSDLHIHTTASDGVLSPSQVVLRAKACGVNCMAISDHDSLGGIVEGEKAALSAEITLIPAVELSTGGEQEIHILGYGVPLANERLQSFLDDMSRERIERADEILAKLADFGISLKLSQIPVGRGGVIGRPQIARAVIAHGYASDMNEVFERFLGNGKPAYVPRAYLDPADAIALLRSVNAVPVLAHPGLMNWTEEKLESTLPAWIDAGLLGLEVYHPAHLPNFFEKWLNCAERHHLLVTGGSDFHDDGSSHAPLGAMRCHWAKMHEDTLCLMNMIDSLKGN